MNKKIKNYIFPILLIVSMILGSIVGIFFPNFSENIKPLGDIFLNLMFTLVVPLVFTTIVSSISNMSSIKRLTKILRNTFIIFIITSFIASLIMLLFSLLFPVTTPNIELIKSSVEKVSVLEQIASALTVSDFNNLLSRSNMLALIIFSIIFGIALNLVEKDKKIVGKIFNTLADTMMKMVKIVMYYAPVGIFAYFASLVSNLGPEFVGSYAKTLVLYIMATIIYFLIIYTIYSYIASGKRGVKNFYKNIFPSILTSLATQSSLASLPTNMEVASKMNIDKDVSNVALPIGSTIHMEGSCMGSILKILFLFSIFGYTNIGIDSYIIALLISVLSGVVMSGIPGGGLIGEMLIVSLYGFPAEAFIIISTIGWLIDAPATMLNVTGDITSCMLIDKYTKKD
ncbi:MAG: dicarboxylate/amino acid:cation symporter [Bacilli bacterium]|nr:dicarboxylate/amino acid:cation symporter [Bacilli bacterium]